MTQPRADKHQGGVPIGERLDHASSSANLAVQPLEHIIGADARPVLAGKVAVGRHLLNAVLDLLGGCIAFSSATTAFAFLREAFLLSCAWIALRVFATILTLDLGTTEKTLQ